MERSDSFSHPVTPLLPAIHSPDFVSLHDQAINVLNNNIRGRFITPSDELYGAGKNNWGYLWDTAFAAMAVASYDAPRGAELLTDFLALQHDNGKIPHMGMWSSTFPKDALATNLNWHAWRFPRHDRAGNRVKTSPITQPPMLAIAAGTIIDQLSGDETRTDFARTVVPKLAAYHAWLYGEREVHDSGLVVTVHPHETGRDDAPSHIDLLKSMPLTRRDKLWLSPLSQRLFETNRTDGVKNLEERSDTDTVMRAAAVAMFHLLPLHRSLPKQGHQKVPHWHPYQHFDPGFNAILDRANDELRRLAEIAEIPLGPSLTDAMDRTAGGLQHFWDPVAQGFRGLDVHGRVELPANQEIGDLLPIISRHITQPQTEAILRTLTDPAQFGGPHLPSVNRSSPRFDADRFWQGADWPQIRILIMDALQRQTSDHARTLAYELGHSALTTAAADGELPEYRDGQTGKAGGARHFSWGAALVLRSLEIITSNEYLVNPTPEVA